MSKRKREKQAQEQSRAVNEEVKDEIREVEKPGKKRKLKYWPLYIAGFAFLVYASITIVNQSMEISAKRETYNNLKDELKIVEIKSENLKKVKNYKGEDLSDYIENIAREDLDFVKNGERIFIIESGD